VTNAAAAEPVLLSGGNAVRVVTLNRPEQLNALDGALHEAVVEELQRIAYDEEVRAVVITGAGRAFSAGGDIDLIVAMQRDRVARTASLNTGRQLFHAISALPVPVIAAVNGPAVGAGCTLALLCDVVFMSTDTYLADPHINVGLVPGDGGAVIWPLLAGLSAARAYLLTGDRVPAAEARRLGLVHRCVPAEDVLSAAVGYATRLAALPSFAIQETKRVLNLHLSAAANLVLEPGLRAEHASFDSSGHAEALSSLQAHHGR
jgi:enoyl-CoA hydratase